MLMFCSMKVYICSAVLALSISSIGFVNRANAQAYQIDCAILLCLSGGWPTSVPCARARAEFIRRITPWPIEPPLQIWRCPLGVEYEVDLSKRSIFRMYDIVSNGGQDLLLKPMPKVDGRILPTPKIAISRKKWYSRSRIQNDRLFHLIQDRANIDISDPQFNFVRSIRVFDIRYARQYEAGSEGGCERSANVYLGTYGMQGNFSWTSSSPAALPTSHIGMENWGQECPNINHRSVFVEWRDFIGNYGFEQINY